MLSSVLPGTAALLILLLFPEQDLLRADPEEVSPGDALRYRELACRSFASVSAGDRTVGALAVTEDGLLLVPAHLLSIATEFRVHALLSSPRANRLSEVTVGSFDLGTVVGIHPRLDLALVQARLSDPRLRFHPIDFARNKVLNRDWVTLSNPYQTVPRRRRVLTTSLGEKEGYFRLDPQGKDETRDLGQFVFDEEARAVGLVSWVQEGGEVLPRALTLAGLRPQDFIAAAEYRLDPGRKELLIRMAEKLLHLPARGFRDPLDDARAHFLIARGLLNDPGDVETYLRVARALPMQNLSETFLMRAISLDPWSSRVKRAYLDLADEFAKSAQMADAEAVWLEMTAKYPTESSPGWTALARYHASVGKYAEAAFEARMAIHTRSDQREEMERLYRSSLGHLDSGQQEKLEGKTRELGRISDQACAAAEKSRAAGKRFMTAGAETLFHPPALFGARPQGTPPLKPSRLPENPRPVEEDATSAYVAARIRVATEYVNAGQQDTAAGILEDVARECPKDPQIAEARRLLRELRKQ